MNGIIRKRPVLVTQLPLPAAAAAAPPTSSSSSSGKTSLSEVLPDGKKIAGVTDSKSGAINQDAHTNQKSLLTMGVNTKAREKRERPPPMSETVKMALNEQTKIGNGKGGGGGEEDDDDEAQKRAKMEMIARESQEVYSLLVQLDEEREKRRALEMAAYGPDGTEKPATFRVTSQLEEDAANGISMDNAMAEKRDRETSIGLYYQTGCFPVSATAAFITRNGRVALKDCEIAFVINGHWWRNQRFADPDDFQRFVEKRTPDRIDIGPAYPSGDPTVFSGTGVKPPAERYLVFDMDLEDRAADRPDGYIRTCRCKVAKTKTVCSHGCWFYMRIAVKALTYVLKKVYDCQYIIPVFSGGRGVHVWVLDSKFVKLTDEERKAIVDRIEMLFNPRVYQHVEYTPYLYEYILKPAFYNHFLDGQRLIKAIDTSRLLFEICLSAIGEKEDEFVADGGLQQTILHLLACMHDNNSRQADRVTLWTQICALVPAPWFEKQVIFTLLAPRIDRNVTIMHNHCIKAIFVVHPTTKRVAVPIPDIDTWLPDMAPRLSDIVRLPEISNPYGWVPPGEDCAGGKGAALTSYVNHVLQMLDKAYPYTFYN